jgi:hypothetical protein
MEALAAETQALTALEAQLRTELRELRARREASETTLSERSAELEKGKRREAELSEQESALLEEDAATAAELGELECSYAGQRIAKAWYASKLPPASFAHAVVSATPVKWASVVTGSRAASATLESALAADGARLRLLEKLWANLGDTAAIVSGAAVLPGVGAVRVAVEAAGYADPSDRPDAMRSLANLLRIACIAAHRICCWTNTRPFLEAVRGRGGGRLRRSERRAAVDAAARARGRPH